MLIPFARLRKICHFADLKYQLSPLILWSCDPWRTLQLITEAHVAESAHGLIENTVKQRNSIHRTNNFFLGLLRLASVHVAGGMLDKGKVTVWAAEP